MANLRDAEENRLLDLSILDTDIVHLMEVLGTDSTNGTKVTGGSYAGDSCTWAAASGGSKATSAALGYTNMPATDVQGWAIYDDDDTTQKWYGLFDRKFATAAASTDVITSAAHGKADGDKIVFLSGYAPAGLTANTTYFVRDSTTNTFKVAATNGGSAIDITTDLADTRFGRVLTVAASAPVDIASGALVCSLD